MKMSVRINKHRYQVNLNKAKSIAISLAPNGPQPNHFGAPNATSQALEMGSYIGDTNRGGSCNANVVTLIPHCNGTHTESVSHIINQPIAVFQAIEQSLFPTVLISLKPHTAAQTQDSYQPSIDQENQVFSLSQIEDLLMAYADEELEGLVIRSLPNCDEKKLRIYNQDNYPPFFTNDAMDYIFSRGVKHLLVDFPSVDKMYDEGRLSNHRIFWNIKARCHDLDEHTQTNKTITEMVYVEDSMIDGLYLCCLQVAQVATDAFPSRPILYPLIKQEPSSNAS